ELRERTEEVAGWNRELEERVAAQLAEIERAGKLRRFLAPQLAEMILARGDESILESHRREIVVVFCDVRGFTGFAERAEPEEVMAFLRATTTPRSGRSSRASRGRSTIIRATASWCSSTIRCRPRSRRSGRSRWRWRCARQ